MGRISQPAGVGVPHVTDPFLATSHNKRNSFSRFFLFRSSDESRPDDSWLAACGWLCDAACSTPNLVAVLSSRVFFLFLFCSHRSFSCVDSNLNRAFPSLFPSGRPQGSHGPSVFGCGGAAGVDRSRAGARWLRFPRRARWSVQSTIHASGIALPAPARAFP